MSGAIRRISDLERELQAEVDQLKAELARLQSVLVWIQPNHLQQARRGPFMCRVAPDRLESDFVPLFAAPKA